MTDKKINPESVTYKNAGVDIEAGEEMVDLIKPMVKSTFNKNVMDNFGSFAGLFNLDLSKFKNPVIAACTDGVGTKLKIAFDSDILDTVGIDLVAMSVNDLICGGAEPMFFLDYLAVGALEPERMAQIVKGIVEGCKQSNCALLGGETAEMPSFYKPKEFDLAGFAVGAAERDEIVTGQNASAGDVAIGLASNGIHSNGYGLARKVMFEIAGFDINDTPEELQGRTVAQELLRPTRIYVKPVMEVLNAFKSEQAVTSMAHITGGGLPGNLPRVLPDGLTVNIKAGSWDVPAIFKLLAEKGPVDSEEMHRVFNMGIGYVLTVKPDFADAIVKTLTEAGETCFKIGTVVEGGPDIQWS